MPNTKKIEYIKFWHNTPGVKKKYKCEPNIKVAND